MGDMDETLRNGGEEAVLARLAAAVPLQPEPDDDRDSESESSRRQVVYLDA